MSTLLYILQRVYVKIQTLQFVKNTFLTTLLILFLPMLSLAQVAKYLDSIRVNGKTYAAPEYLWKNANVSTLSAQLTGYVGDTARLLAEAAYEIMFRAGMASSDINERQMSMEFIAKGLDGETGVAYRNISYLEEYSPVDVNELTQKILEKRLDDWKQPYYSRVAKLSAQLGVGRLQIRRRQQLDNNADTELKWDLHLAMARLGEQTDIDFVARKARAIHYGYSEDLMAVIVPQLIYTRQKQAIDLCVEMLQADNCKCASVNPTVDAKILCGYRVMEKLAPVIRGFPYKTSATGMIVCDNYEDALATIREWFQNHPDYCIISD